MFPDSCKASPFFFFRNIFQAFFPCWQNWFKMSASPVARIEELEEIEKDVIAILQTAGTALNEISRDRPSQKQVDQLTQQVMGHIRAVDTKLSEQIRYLTQVSTGHPHEGSSYPSQKVLQTAWHRLEHARSRIAELDRVREQAGLASVAASASAPITMKEFNNTSNLQQHQPQISSGLTVQPSLPPTSTAPQS